MALVHLFLLLSLISVSSGATIVARLNPGGTRLSLSVGTPPQKQLLAVDLNAETSWLPCGKNSSFEPGKSSTFSPLPCSSNACSGHCSKNKCLLPISPKTSVPAFQETLTGFTAPGGAKGTAIFGCAAGKSVGVAALSKNSFALPLQIASSFSVPRKFALCLSPDSPSSLFVGDDSSIIIGGINISSLVSFVPFVSNPVFPSRYYLDLRTIQTDFSDLKLDPSLFSINPKTGIGGLTLSSTNRYTKFPTPVYAAIAQSFKKYATAFNISIVPARNLPFDLCFNASGMNFNRLGPVFPAIQLIFRNNIPWNLVGSRVIEFFRGNAIGCLAIQSAGDPPATSSIGLFHQFDNLLYFDLAQTRFGFVDRSLHILRQSCKFS
ncbi:aspartic proteinase nepenthesin-1-like [Selaginella moellendorffii]|uniref:aspartic proteinase nepenthesin-1-like n=1 Tax=Selaginella moellendorffii TaxID=88036 RepID=UPI000D1C5516|nr:aspartic proteinase nepenthesin-1-like [Selaginella moellendorffii]|eukprot:XP_024520871.1 aspartic proteinase nepenthesin-1-like [Selaginella moellendorffii]